MKFGSTQRRKVRHSQRLLPLAYLFMTNEVENSLSETHILETKNSWFNWNNNLAKELIMVKNIFQTADIFLKIWMYANFKLLSLSNISLMQQYFQWFDSGLMTFLQFSLAFGVSSLAGSKRDLHCNCSKMMC